MVAESWIFQAIQAGKTYDSLPPRIKASLSLTEWKAKVKQYCIQNGFSWSNSIANTSAAEHDYYEELIEFYKKNERLFPYHLAHYVCRILRVTTFRYYFDILFNCLKEEKAYDQIPNFTAADILRHLGIGRNEYISILDACRAKKFIWRMNRNIAKEKLPSEPVSMVMEPWWKVGVVNLTENEYRALSGDELDFLQNASAGNPVSLADVNYEMLRTLYRRGLIYVRVPIRDDDKFTIPPLEGFISNRNVSSNPSGVDPMESLLYSVFIAISENMPLSSLADVLNVDIIQLKSAMGVAVRLGFATRLDRDPDGDSSGSFDLNLRENEDEEETADADRSVVKPLFSSEPPGDAQAIAVLVDAETTSFLMMGLLSSGIKRHAVTLFEGGRVSGEEVISHLISELRNSANNGEVDAEIRRLMQTASALADLLECVQEASSHRSIELLRKESLEGLSGSAVTRVLAHSYKAVVPIAPLSGDPLPLDNGDTKPLYFGPTGSVASLWFQLACYEHLRAGPSCYVFVSGQRVSRLPKELTKRHTALLSTFPYCKTPHLVHQPFILHHLNELCRLAPVLIQPLFFEPSEENSITKFDDLEFVDVPLPIREDQNVEAVQGFYRSNGKPVEIAIPKDLPKLMVTLGLSNVVGFLRFSKNCNEMLVYTPFHVFLGVPLSPAALCNAVCASARERKIIHPKQAEMVYRDQNIHANLVAHIQDRFCQQGAGMLPKKGFVFDGGKLRSGHLRSNSILSVASHPVVFDDDNSESRSLPRTSLSEPVI